MTERGDDDEMGAISVRIPARLVAAIFGSVATVLGTGYLVGSQAGSTVTSETVRECATAMEVANEAIELARIANTNSSTALSVRGQHGDEFESVTAQLADVQNRITVAFNLIDRIDAAAKERDAAEHIFTIERTASRHTAEQERAHEDAHRRRYDLLQERVAQHERGMKHMEADLQRLEKLFRDGRTWVDGPD